MGRYRKKPVEIEARQWDGTHESTDSLTRWADKDGALVVTVGEGWWSDLRRHDEIEVSVKGTLCRADAPAFLIVEVPSGPNRLDVGDWLIRGVAGEFYPCRADIFEATYEVVCADDAHEEVKPL